LQLKLDLHVHTHFSSDSIITPEELVFYAKKRGLNGVAITDHDRLDSALKIARESDFFVIPGIEITSSDGHMIGLNVKRHVPSGFCADVTVNKIHEAGGIAIACHPIALFKGSPEKHVTPKFDAVEVVNASAFPFNYCAMHSRQLASSAGIRSCVAGSDAHYGPEIGYAYTVMDAMLEINEVIETIRKGACQPFGNAIPLTLRLKRIALTRLKKGEMKKGERRD
jgi:predicted metal-dependent phosphoesterase TrpH